MALTGRSGCYHRSYSRSKPWGFWAMQQRIAWRVRVAAEICGLLCRRRRQRHLETLARAGAHF